MFFRALDWFFLPSQSPHHCQTKVSLISITPKSSLPSLKDPTHQVCTPHQELWHGQGSPGASLQPRPGTRHCPEGQQCSGEWWLLPASFWARPGCRFGHTGSRETRRQLTGELLLICDIVYGPGWRADRPEEFHPISQCHRPPGKRLEWL